MLHAHLRGLLERMGDLARMDGWEEVSIREVVGRDRKGESRGWMGEKWVEQGGRGGH